MARTELLDAIVKARRVHFIGIGGIGMSGLAQMLLARGVAVSGSDVRDSPMLSHLRAASAEVFVGHHSDNLRGADLVVFSTAIQHDNPELAAARQQGIRAVHRSELLEMLLADRRVIAVAGTHGKSTTTAMVAQILIHAGLDPSVMLGAESVDFDGNFRAGADAWFIAEADESDGSFLRCTPEVGVVTNVECDHMDYFRDEQHVVDSFQQFMHNLQPGGIAIVGADGVNARGLRAAEGVSLMTYGTSADAEFRIVGYEADAKASRFQVERNGDRIARVCLRVPGPHNALNATAALIAAHHVGLEWELAAEALADYRGIKRRMEIVGECNGAAVVDDYAHHPSEVAATLRAARERWPHIVAVFQPHRYSRTRDLANEFGDAFADADLVIITEIYAAFEQPIPGVSGKLIVDAVAARRAVEFIAERNEVLKRAKSLAQPQGAILMMGAGDITHWARELIVC